GRDRLVHERAGVHGLCDPGWREVGWKSGTSFQGLTSTFPHDSCCPPRHIGTYFGRASFNQSAKLKRATRTAVNSDVPIPIASVRAKPWTGPEPSWNITRAAIRVVRFESRMLDIAWSNPVSTAETGDRPAFCSSRIRSLIRTLASTAIPMV